MEVNALLFDIIPHLQKLLPYIDSLIWSPRGVTHWHSASPFEYQIIPTACWFLRSNQSLWSSAQRSLLNVEDIEMYWRPKAGIPSVRMSTNKTCLFISNIATGVSWTDLEGYFSPFGRVRCCYHRSLYRHWGIGVVNYWDSLSARRANILMQDYPVGNRNIRIEWFQQEVHAVHLQSAPDHIMARLGVQPSAFTQYFTGRRELNISEVSNQSPIWVYNPENTPNHIYKFQSGSDPKNLNSLYQSSPPVADDHVLAVRRGSDNRSFLNQGHAQDGLSHTNIAPDVGAPIRNYSSSLPVIHHQRPETQYTAMPSVQHYADRDSRQLCFIPTLGGQFNNFPPSPPSSSYEGVEQQHSKLPTHALYPNQQYLGYEASEDIPRYETGVQQPTAPILRHANYQVYNAVPGSNTTRLTLSFDIEIPNDTIQGGTFFSPQVDLSF